jgi:tyrosyl-DNA phosphodiesterase-1
MASEWDDEELARFVRACSPVDIGMTIRTRAIARSLEETSAGSRDAPISIEDETIVIDDGSDTESESSSDVNAQLKRVLDLSKADVTVKAEPKPPAPSTSSSTPAEASSSKAEANAPLPPPTAGPLSFMAERAKLEQARLERLKRLRPETDQPDPAVKRARSSPPSSDTEDDDATELTRPVCVLLRSAALPHLTGDEYDSKPLPAASKGKEKAAKPEDEIFWNGELRQTANSLADPSKDKRSVFRLSEIIGPVGYSAPCLYPVTDFLTCEQKKDVAFALLASYSIDWPWIYQMFDPATPVVCVAQPDQSGNESIKEVLPNWIKTTPFLRLGRGCMHMKVCWHLRGLLLRC